MKSKTFGVSALLLILASIFNLAQAAPSVHWSEDSISATLSRDGHAEIQLQLNAVVNLGDVYLWVTPEIEAYVDISPTMLSDVLAGDSNQIQIHLNAGADAPIGLFDGTIQVREKVSERKRGKVFARPLPIQLLIQEPETIAGVDDDGNNVWDYIDQYINETYAGADKESLRAALRQFALSIQGGLLNADNKELSLRYATAGDRAMECVFYLKSQEANAILSDLEAVVLNTKARSEAYLMFSKQSAGHVFPSTPYSQRSASCIAD